MNNKNKQNLIIISGPTASGKTDLSINLAKDINGSIISADSMQVYKGMDIGSAKISKDEMQGVKHYLIDVLDPHEDFNIVMFKQFAKNDIDLISKDNKIPIVVGGTGFYIQALLYDIDFSDEASEDKEIREKLLSIAKDKGNDYIHNMLADVDSKAASTIHKNDTKRIIRALEFNMKTGGKISEHNDIQRENESPYNFKYFVITKNREQLYKDIDRRVDIMIEKGLVDEVKRLKEQGLTKDNVSMKGLGYKEILAYLDGDITLDKAIEIIKRDTRHFAKRQLTWFKRERNVIWINKDDFENNEFKILEFIKEQLKNEGII